MTPEIDEKLAELKNIYGPYSLSRVEDMLYKKEEVDPLQKDARLLLPSLSTTPWLSTQQFDVLQRSIDAVENASADIKKEIWNTIDHQTKQLEPYKHYLGVQSDWSALYLYKEGKKNEDVKELLPVTYQLLEKYLFEILCPVSEMHFSILEPGAKIAPHSDLCNFALNLHLAVDIPEECYITVAGETRQWQEGKCLLFDYSYQHEACNLSSKKRICLLMDIWHPHVTLAEKEALIFVVNVFKKLVA